MIMASMTGVGRVRAAEAAALVRRDVGRARVPILAGFAVTGLVVALVVVLHLGWGVAFRALTQDPTAYLGVQAYVGAVSTLGGVLWAVAGTACLLAAHAAQRAGRARERTFFLASGLFSFALCADDLLQLHEDLLPLAGVPQLAILAAYAGAGLAHLVAFRATIRAHAWPLMVLALGFLALSVVQDVVFTHGDLQSFFEDAAKLAGIVFWTLFFVLASAEAVDPMR